jgi:acetoin:2,6-dichlorophenolindophenol oxidoreductase subunit alpha
MTATVYSDQSADAVIAAPPPNLLREMLARMLVIRRVEERLGSDSLAGRLPGNVHLCVGQEAVAVGVCSNLSDDDYITSTHRGHGHFIAKGGEPRRMVAEVYARATGICGGFGGSMHVADVSKSILGANGIVGGGFAIAAGAALACSLNNNSNVSVCFFGDGAAAQGTMCEVMNVAALWRLPLVLVCEYNSFSEFSPSATVTAGEISARARPYGIPSEVVDGNDPVAVWRAAHTAIQRARRGEGPSFIEARTYRVRGHLEAEAGFLTRPYRTDEEIAHWKQRDPIVRLSSLMQSEGLLTTAEYEGLDAAAHELVREAVEYAEASPLPAVESLQCNVFVNQTP